jgi:hypothetical protein
VHPLTDVRDVLALALQPAETVAPEHKAMAA